MTFINMLIIHTDKSSTFSCETFGFFGFYPEASLEEFFRLNSVKYRKSWLNGQKYTTHHHIHHGLNLILCASPA